MSQAKDVVTPDEEDKSSKSKELLKFLCEQLRGLIAANISENGKITPWRRVLAADVAPGCEQYSEECEDLESDDDAVFSAAAAQHTHTTTSTTKRKRDSQEGYADDCVDCEPNDLLSQLAPTVTTALEKLKESWAAQRQQKRKERDADCEEQLSFAEQLSALKKRWRSCREIGMPSFEEAESDMDPEEEFEPEVILKQRVRQQTEQYFVKWLGYSVGESTWEKPENIASHCTLECCVHGKQR